MTTDPDPGPTPPVVPPAARRFLQLDVFSDEAFRGNPLAVILDGDGLDEEEMLRIAAWTNLSETTFLLPPTQVGADYRVRIMTTTGELPFAGHPTLGSARAWLEVGGTPQGDRIIQECGAGLVEVRRDGTRLAFAAPPLRRSGPLEETDVLAVAASLGIPRETIIDHAWCDNGPGWKVVQLDAARSVLDLEPAMAVGMKVGVIGPYPEESPHPAGADYEVRAFLGPDPRSGSAACEDPVTGSLNAGIAQWLVERDGRRGAWIASQGARRGRHGMVHIDVEAEETGESVIWVGGDAQVRISGEIRG